MSRLPMVTLLLASAEGWRALKVWQLGPLAPAPPPNRPLGGILQSEIQFEVVNDFWKLLRVELDISSNLILFAIFDQDTYSQLCLSCYSILITMQFLSHLDCILSEIRMRNLGNGGRTLSYLKKQLYTFVLLLKLTILTKYCT